MNKYIEIGEQAANKDPRMAKFGMFSGESSALYSVRIFVWFESLDLLTDFLLNGEPRIGDFDDADIGPYQERISPVITRFLSDGLTDDLRLEFNKLVSDFLRVDWWGSFEDLTLGEAEFCRRLREDYRDSKAEEGEPITDAALSPNEFDDFIDFIRQYGF